MDENGLSIERVKQLSKLNYKIPFIHKGYSSMAKLFDMVL